MNYLTALQTVIDDNRDLLGIQCPQREIWLENGVLKPGSNKQSESGIHLIDLEYRLCLAIERLNNAQAGLLVLLINQFAGGIDRVGLEDISFSVAPNDDHTVDVEFSMGVREPVNVVEVEHSPIVCHGKKVGFGEGSLNVAEALVSVTTQYKG